MSFAWRGVARFSTCLISFFVSVAELYHGIQEFFKPIDMKYTFFEA